MLGFYIKHSIYNKYLGFVNDKKVWTSKEKAYLYFTQLTAEASIKIIKQEPKYKNIKLIVTDRNNLEVSIIE